ncbi:MAG TPA: RHS repeat-associated core domain-containing protein [Bacillota bacterium]
MVTDENGNKVVERDFTPFGQRIDQAGHEGKFPEETEDGFTGKDWDEDIGLYYFNARWYDPEVGRFISEDSVADDPNLYSYCGQNPVNNVDPTGNFSIGLQQGWNMVGSMINATALLSKNETLGMISSVFSLFVAIDGRWGLSNIMDDITDLFSGNSFEKQLHKNISGYIDSKFELESIARDPDELYGAILNINRSKSGSVDSGKNGIESSTATGSMDFQQKKIKKRK